MARARSRSGASAAIARAYSSSACSTGMPMPWWTMNQKKTATRASRAAPMASMIARSLTKTEPRQNGRPRHGGRTGASVIRARDQAVPHAAHGLDEGGMAGVVAELLAQAAHEDVD